MQKELLHDLIERYMVGALSQSEQKEVAHRIATDSEFRAELELHRAMQQQFGDPGEMRLRFALDAVLQPPPPAEIPAGGSSNSGWLRLAGLLALLALAGFVIWFWQGNEIPASTPMQEPVHESAPTPRAEGMPAPVHPPEQDSRSKPMAMANPADFEANPVLDARISRVRGGGDVEVDLSSPAPAATFLLKNGRISLPVKGSLSADSMAARQPIRMFIYSNRLKDWENEKALFNLDLLFEPAGAGAYRVNFIQHLPLARPGLYYVVVGQKRPAEDGGGYRTLWVGKFTAVRLLNL